MSGKDSCLPGSAAAVKHDTCGPTASVVVRQWRMGESCNGREKNKPVGQEPERCQALCRWCALGLGVAAAPGPCGEQDAWLPEAVGARVLQRRAGR